MTAGLSLRLLRKSFVAPVLRGLDLDITPGQVHALVGENGAGKSTLARIVAGLLPPDEGVMTLEGAPYAPRDRRAALAAGVRLCLQELTAIETLSVAENLALADLPRRWGLVDRTALHERARRALEPLGLGSLDPATPLGSLGVGQRQLVELAGALAQPGRLLILDEPTAALTRADTLRLFELLRARVRGGESVLYISHRLEELTEIADQVTVLRDGLVVRTGTPAELSPDDLVRWMVGRPVDDERRPMRRSGPTTTPGLRVEGLTVGSSVRDVSFTAHRGEILGLAGLVGAGRTETLRAIFGADRRERGRIEVGARVASLGSPAEAVAHGIALLTEDRKSQGLLLPLGLDANISLAQLDGLGDRLGLIRRDEERALAGSWQKKLAIRAADVAQPIVELSGGNQQKALIARWLARGADILLLDEPTRGIDVGARQEVHQLLWALADEGKTLVVASSDLRELMALCDRILVLSKGRVTGEFAREAFDQHALLTAAFAEHREEFLS